MLHQLQRYAQDHDLAVKYGFNNKSCKWAIIIDAGGELIDLLQIDRNFRLCPEYPANLMNAGGRSHFLIETKEVILPPAKNIKFQAKHNFFMSLLEEASAHEDSLKACLAFMNNAAEMEKFQARMDDIKVKPNDKMTFRIEDDYPVLKTSWHDWWVTHVRSQSSDKAKNIGIGKGKQESQLCLLSGEMTTPVMYHNKIKLDRVNGQASGSVLIGFDKDAFSSYGLTASANAAMSEESVLTYTAALNDMIKNAGDPLGHVLFLYGYDKPVPLECDLAFLLTRSNMDGAGKHQADDMDAERNSALLKFRELLESVQRGKQPEYLNNRYYVWLVSGAAGRVMVRDYMEGSCDNLAVSLQEWFDDLSLIGSVGTARDALPKLKGLLVRLVDYGSSKVFERISKELSGIIPRIWRSVLTGAPLPDTVAQRALRYIRSHLLANETTQLDASACMWLKVWLIRTVCTSKEGTRMKEGLNRAEPSQAYQFGRLLAVYGKLQEEANPNINTGIVQRYFASASQTPALVFGRLESLSRHNLAKLEKGKSLCFEKELQEVASHINPADIPVTLSLREQTLFTLGYYHQRAEKSSQNTSHNSPLPAMPENENEEDKNEEPFNQ